jgi:RNA polymerase sigma-70 factor, ECF subfamily
VATASAEGTGPLGDKASKADRFLEHLEPLRGPLEGFCRRALWDPGAVPDVLQSAVANAYRDFHLYAQGTNFRAWIFAYVHREVLNANRRARRTRHAELPPELEAGGPAALEPDRRLEELLLDDPERVLDECDEALAEMVRGLPPRERAALLLQAVGGFKYREIAEILRGPVGTVMSSLARCQARLRRQLAEFGQARGLLRPEGPDAAPGAR